MTRWYEVRPNGVILKLTIQPRASRTEIVGLHGEPPRLKIRVASPPVEGEANEELLRFLKKTLGVKLAQLSILRGDSSRSKDVFCAELTEAQVRSFAAECLG